MGRRRDVPPTDASLSDVSRARVVGRDNDPREIERHPKAIGDLTTLAVMLVLNDLGYTVLVPFGENTRYDLVIDVAGRLERVQCKTGRLRKGSICFATCSSYAHHPNPKVVQRTYVGQADHFGVYCPETGGVYLVPLGAARTVRVAALRVEPTQNGQQKFIRLAKDYEVGRVVCTTRGLRASAGG
jgi:PD-(D/E)XK endonuclease